MAARITQRKDEVKHGVKAKVNDKLFSFKVTQSGAAPLVVNFAALGLPNMKDTDYRILPTGETAARTTVDESTIAKTGFNILGGADTEVHHIWIDGQVDEGPA